MKKILFKLALPSSVIVLCLRKGLLKIFLLTALCFLVNTLFAQELAKPPIDTSTYTYWRTVNTESAIISDDGKYVVYSINQGKLSKDPEDIIIKSTTSTWEKSFPGVDNFFTLVGFTKDSKYALISKASTVYIIKNGTGSLDSVINTGSVKLLQDNLLYIDNKAKAFVIKNLSTNKSFIVDNVENYDISKTQACALLHRKMATGEVSLDLLNLTNPGTLMNIWKGEGLGRIVFDSKDEQIAFEVNEGKNKNIWYYKAGQPKAGLLTDTQATLDEDLQLSSISHFSYNGEHLFIQLVEVLGEPVEDPVALNIWTYHDKKAKSEGTFGESSNAREFAAVIHLKDRSLIRLQEEEDERIEGIDESNKTNWVFVTTPAYLRYVPGKDLAVNLSLLNIITGERKKLPFRPYYSWSNISPGGKFVVSTDRNGFSNYEIATGNTINLTKDINTEWNKNDSGYGGGYWEYPTPEIVGWLKDDAGVLVRDAYDIWLLDMKGIKKPVCITNRYGLKNSIVFYLATDESSKKKIYSDKEKIMLAAINANTKDNGFYTVRLGEEREPQELLMSPHGYFFISGGLFESRLRAAPKKAANANVWLVHRERANEAPNLFVTSDFKTFKAVSDVYPEKNYNWMTSEIHSFKLADSTPSLAVLYKPGNFDPGKKYPVIFYYYEGLTDNLNVYIRPEPCDGKLNIAWYVSNGYLVCLADMHHPKQIELFKGCLNSIESAAKYIGKLPYVDAAKLGMTGISWGGILTNYFVTNTGLFAAACSASGLGNLLSQAGITTYGDFSYLGFEGTWMGPGKSIWEATQWFLDNSPVMNAPKTTTPLLMMETTNDGATPFINAFELYSALRRLGKKVWMLEYTKKSEANHGVWGRSSRDFDIRLKQFFGHFLKDEPAPVWMTKGIPSKLKNIDLGLQIDKEPNSVGLK